ncbi:hypothetical protein A9264_05425 [Vibrio sp. UCD-FRSSP16_10]|nr:hypothetical protein A9260_07665 [Vibrio sp. UCD-FRSSP16_30]OBT17192.1 hypothetical protein A9264_05425 [Vibrio sp. UCD-FRSSP16_10]
MKHSKYGFIIILLALSGCNSGTSSTPSNDIKNVIENTSTIDKSTANELNNYVESVKNTNTDSDSDWNINQWKLTLPISKTYFRDNFDHSISGGSSAAELVPGGCRGSNASLSEKTSYVDYFYIGNDGHTHFKVNLSDPSLATTENTSYVRSELRELYHYKTQSGCNTDKQNWHIQDNNAHRLESTLTIKQAPNVSQPKVVIGQVHGQHIKQALVKLLWEGNSRPIRAIINDNFVEGNNKCSNSHCHPFSIDLGKAKVGEEFSYMINVDQQGIVIKAANVEKRILWGQTIKSDGNSYTLSKNWTNPSNSFYFKAGIYPQLKPGSTNGVFDVSFSKIAIEHE